MPFTRNRARAILLCLAFLLAAAPAGAQSFGVRGGLTFATFAREAPPDVVFLASERDPRLVGGVFVGTVDRMPIGVQVEALYEEIGSKTVQPESHSRLRYLTLPALAKVRIVSQDRVRAHALAGVSLGVLLDSTRTDEGGVEVDNDDEVESTNVGLVLGGSVSIARLIVDARYTWGLTNLVAAPAIPGIESRSRVFVISAGVRFGP